jgi:hypothetical protein
LVGTISVRGSSESLTLGKARQLGLQSLLLTPACRLCELLRELEEVLLLPLLGSKAGLDKCEEAVEK